MEKEEIWYVAQKKKRDLISTEIEIKKKIAGEEKVKEKEKR